MKTLSILLIGATIFCAACGENDASRDSQRGGEQVKPPVMNSGPEAERERAINATSDSTARGDSDATGKPR